MNEKLKCFQTMLGFRKNCIGEKCALHIVLYSKDASGAVVEKPMCSHKASCIAQLDIIPAIDRQIKK